jgi:hypothetical protein
MSLATANDQIPSDQEFASSSDCCAGSEHRDDRDDRQGSPQRVSMIVPVPVPVPVIVIVIVVVIMPVVVVVAVPRSSIVPAIPVGAVMDEREHRISYLGEVFAEVFEDARGHAVLVAKQAQEQVLGTDEALLELGSLSSCPIDHLEHRRRELRRARRPDGDAGALFSRLCSCALEGDSDRLECGCGESPAFVDQSEQHVLGADEVALHQFCFLLSQDYRLSRSVREAFVHLARLCLEGPELASRTTPFAHLGRRLVW